MTPFGIRKKLVALVGTLIPGGGGPKPPPAASRPKITLVVVYADGQEATAQAEAESTVIEAAANLARPIATGCADSTCGTCRVEVLEGAENLFPAQDARERATLKDNGFPTNLRLGCRVQVNSGIAKVRPFELVT